MFGWRKVPVDQSQVGAIAAQTEPEVRKYLLEKAIKKLANRSLTPSYLLPEK